MAKNNYQVLTDVFSIGPSGSINVDIDMKDIEDLKVLSIATFAVTDDPTGITVHIHYGFSGQDDSNTEGKFVFVAGTDAEVTWSDNYATPSMVAFDPSEGDPQTKNTFFYAKSPDELLPRWIRLEIENLDGTNSVTLQLLGDI